MAQATERQREYLNDLIWKARQYVGPNTERPNRYQARKYGDRPTGADELASWRKTVIGNKATDRAEFAALLNGWLDGLRPDEMDQAQASSTIDALKSGWIEIALDTHFEEA